MGNFLEHFGTPDNVQNPTFNHLSLPPGNILG